MHGQIILQRGPRGALERVRPYLMTAMLPIVVLAVGSLVLEYGFQLSDGVRYILHRIELVALVAMMLDSPLRLALARRRWELLRYRWIELSVALAYVAVVAGAYATRMEHAQRILLVATQIGIIINVVLRLLELNRYVAMLRVRPALLLIGSVATVIAIGTGLLLLPGATAEGRETTFLEALFTATSAVCATGLTVVDTGKQFTWLGQYTVLGLIQLGGLGLMAFTSVFAIFMWRGLRVRDSLVMREVVSHDLVTEIKRVLAFTVIASLCIEAVGALFLMGVWQRTCTGAEISAGQQVYYSVFHSVAAFCNAGFSLYADNLTAFRSAWEVNLILPLLIIAGGVGFGVLYNLVRVLRYRLIGSGPSTPLVKKRLTLQTKLVLVVTAVLIVGGTALAYIFETWPGGTRVWNVTAYMPAEGSEVGGVQATGAAGPDCSPFGETWSERLVRTAGFHTTDTARLSPPTKFMTVVLMFIGASPGSTGGGIKTVTFAVIVLGIWTALRGRPHATAFHRTVSWETVTRALAIMAVAAVWVALVTLLVLAWGLREDARFTFLDVLFEVTSAFGTVGLSTGTTALLNPFGQCLIMLSMFVGRIGPITLLVTMQGRTEKAAKYVYPTENVATA